ncbi:MAG: hypothetical protein NZM09_06720 [Ignavibacterium sp.]|nr:hypothetical protein [Ignavibacterium sp.]MDW8375374.1 hypothetical protein [Ignavibacteriales bacterium]
MKEKEILRSSSLIFYLLLSGQIFFMVFALIFVENNSYKADNNFTFLLTISFLIILAPMLVIGPIIYRKIISNKSNNLESIEEKLFIYRKGMIIKLAMIESLSLFSTTIFIISGSYLFVVINIFLIVLFYLHKPSLEKFASDFNLSISDIEKYFR